MATVSRWEGQGSRCGSRSVAHIEMPTCDLGCDEMLRHQSLRVCMPVQNDTSSSPFHAVVDVLTTGVKEASTFTAKKTKGCVVEPHTRY
jgi:hypothetical protein